MFCRCRVCMIAVTLLAVAITGPSLLYARYTARHHDENIECLEHLVRVRDDIEKHRRAAGAYPKSIDGFPSTGGLNVYYSRWPTDEYFLSISVGDARWDYSTRYGLDEFARGLSSR